MRSGSNLPVERLSLIVWLDAQLIAQDRPQPLILGDGSARISGGSEQRHELAVRIFAPGIGAQQLRQRIDGAQRLPLGNIEAGQIRQRVQSQQPVMLPLSQRPLIEQRRTGQVEPGKKFTAVKCGRSRQRSRPARAHGRFECRRVGHQRHIGSDGDLVAGNLQEGTDHGTQIGQDVAQVLARPLLGYVAPQQAGQMTAPVRFTSRSQIENQRARFERDEASHRLAGKSNTRAAEHGDGEGVHVTG